MTTPEISTLMSNLCSALQEMAQNNRTALDHIASKANKDNSTTSLPERFEGTHRSQELAKQFITGLESYFRLLRTDSLTDERKINIAVSRLKGAANTWIDPYQPDLNKNIYERSNSFLKTWEGFCREFMSRFGDSMPKQHAYDQLYELKQTGSVVEYATRFRHLYEIYDPAASDSHKYYDFRRGLKRPIRAALAARGSQAPGENDFDAYVADAIRTDEEIFDTRTRSNPGRAGNHTGNHSGNHQPTNYQAIASQHSSVRSEPMDLSATQSGPMPKVSSKPVSTQEREYRRANNLCFYCGEKHRIANCPKKSQDRSFRSY